MFTKQIAPVPLPNTASADVVDKSLDLSRMVATARSTPTQETKDFNEFLRLKKARPDASNEDTRGYMAFMRIAPSPSPEMSGSATAQANMQEDEDISRVTHGEDTRTIDSRPY